MVASEEEGITVTTKRLAPDPLRGLNAASFEVVNKVDEAVIGPAATPMNATCLNLCATGCTTRCATCANR
jgi:ABC-type transporter lipoprotein component MlaA